MARDGRNGIPRSRRTPVVGEDALVRKHRRLAGAIAQDYYLPGAAPEDVNQEAMVGLLVAVREHDPARGPFSPFASRCINAWLQSCVSGANRHKHRMLNDAVGDLWLGDGEGAKLSLIDAVEGSNTDPTELLETRDELRRIVAIVGGLSELERHALVGVLNGHEYTELGEFKSIDNALVRARAKLRRAA